MNKLRKIRVNLLGMTQYEFANLIDQPQSKISKYENDKLKVSLKLFLKIKNILDERGFKLQIEDFTD